MFRHILGHDGRGNPFLKQITIVPNAWFPNGSPTCHQFLIGYSPRVHNDPDHPIIFLCPNALSIGGIDKGYIPTDPSHHGYVQALPVFCNSLGPHAFWRMLTLAHFLISILMTIPRFSVPPLRWPARGHAPFESVTGAQALSAGPYYYCRLPEYAIPGCPGPLIPNVFPLRNAASFAWFSTHLF